jgi:hypothetical protein
VFKRVAEAALRHLAVPPSVNPVPPVLVARASDRDAPAPQPARAASLLEPSLLHVAREGLMPDLRGLSGREALRILARAGLTARIRGDGLVTDQNPEAGTPVERGAVCVLHLRREPNQAADPAARGATP